MTRDEVVKAVADGKSLAGANLNGADLCESNLRGADCGGANLRGANLNGANLRGANLNGANLRGADLISARLRDASLIGANLRDANLNGADLRDAKLHSVEGFICAGSDPRGYHFFGVSHASGWIVKAGCRWFTIQEAIDHWSAAGNKDALLRVAVIQNLGREF